MGINIKFRQNWADIITHEDSRQHLQFVCVFIIMAFISAFMTVMNYITGWTGELMFATLTFAVLNVINAFLEYIGKDNVRKIPRVLFAVEIILLFTFFVINGQPKGFSTLWAALLPACGLLLYKVRIGSIISGTQLLILVFLFYIPAGQQLLNFDYNDVFMMRFPVLYTAFFIVGVFFEIVRHYTQEELASTRDRYMELYAKEEERANKEKETNYLIMQVLADDYKVIFGVDIQSSKFQIFSGEEYLRDISGMAFPDAVTVYASKYVTEDYRDIFEMFCSAENIVSELKDNDSTMLTYVAKVNGNEHYLQAKFIKIPEEDGAIRKVIVAVSDTDAFVREQQQIQQELRQQREKANKANRAKSDFLFNISHDIRTPMNAIIGFTDIAANNLGNEEVVRESLRKAHISSDMLESLIDDILDMSSIENGKIAVVEEKADLVSAYENIKSIVSDSAEAKNISLSFDTSGIKKRYVYTDISRFTRMIMNLVTNAIKYTNEGGQVQVTARQIDDAKLGVGIYKFIVKDNGIGMSEEFQKEMFEQFAREGNTTTSGIVGTGLGLPLAKKVAEALGGRISCESKQGIGSIFTVTIPFRVYTDKDIEEKRTEEGPVDFNGKRVLVVEDNELNREITMTILGDNGMLPDYAPNGKIALDMISQKEPDFFDIVLMDIQMPVMDGYEATKEIRKLYSPEKLPIIAVSANAFDDDRLKSLEAGMNALVSKPFNAEKLLSAISKYL